MEIDNKWIVRHTAAGIAYTVCSRCKMGFKLRTKDGGFLKLDLRPAKYCPNCGAKMHRAKGINLPFVVAAEKTKEFLQRDSSAFERLMDKARANIPDFDNKRVKR